MPFIVSILPTGTVTPPPSGGGGSLSLLQPSDITTLGAFKIPATHDLDFCTGLTGRYVSGVVKLYTTNYVGTDPGYLIEFDVVSDGNLSIAGPFNTASGAVNYGDIYQNAITRDVANGGSGTQPPPLVVGLPYANAPSGFYWDPTDARMYWGRTLAYNNTTTTSDTCLGYSTLNGTAGTGVGMWKLSPPSVYGNRWCDTIVEIPPVYQASFGGRRFVAGFGGNRSIIANGPFSMGPCMFACPAMNPLDTPNTYITSGSVVPLINYPAFTVSGGQAAARAPRDASLLSAQEFPDPFTGNSAVWNWADGSGGMGGAWIRGTNKEGVIFFTHLSIGTTNTTVSASPTPTHTSMTVANGSSILVGDVIRFESRDTQGQGDYPFSYAYITGVSGNAITFSGGLINGCPNPPCSTYPTDIPLAGGYVKGGGWYQGGGGATQRWTHALYMYDPADLVSAYNGASPALTPYSMLEYQLPTQTYPLAGTNQDGGAKAQVKGMWFDTTTNRLYVLNKECPNGTTLIHVMTVNC